ncbi:MAG: hypothetical protein AAF468_11485 [Pseudomonadota bacterium]
MTATGAGTGRSTLSLVGNSIIESISTGSNKISGLYGVQGEVGVTLPVDLPPDNSIRFSAGAFHFEGNGAQPVTGATAGFEYNFNNALGIDGARFTVGVGVIHDTVRKTDFTAEVRLTIPVGSVAQSDEEGEATSTNQPALTALERQMQGRVRRFTQVPTQKVNNLRTENRVAVDARDGSLYNSIFFADGANSTGAGTQPDPTTLDDAVLKAAAGNGIIVAEGNNGVIFTPDGVTLKNGQDLLGGGTTVPVRLRDGRVVNFTLGQTNGIIQNQSNLSDTIRLGNTNILQNFSVRGGLNGISGDGVGGINLINVRVSNTAGDGFRVRNPNGPFNATGFQITDVGGDGIDILGASGTFTFVDTDISGAGGSGVRLSGGIDTTFDGQSTISSSRPVAPSITIEDHTGTLTFDGTIDATSGTGLQFDDADGTYDFNGQVTLNGGDAGIDILGDSAGTFTFANTDITNPTGPSVRVDGGSANVNFGPGSSINHNSNSSTIDVLNGHTGTITFGGPINSTNGTGLQFDNADGTYNFNGEITLNGTAGGADVGIDILNDSAGTFTFSGLTTINNTAGGAGVNIDGGSANTTFTGGINITTNNGTGLRINNNTGLTTILNGVPNVINATGGPAIDINNSNVNLDIGQVTSNNSATDGIALFNLPGTANVRIGRTAVGNATQDGIEIFNSGGTLTFFNTTINGGANDGVAIEGGTGTFTFNTLNINGAGDEGFDVDNSNATVNVNNATITGSGDDGLDISDSGGTFTFSNITVSNTTNHGVNVNGNNGRIDFNGTTNVNNSGGAGVLLNAAMGGPINFNDPLNVNGAGIDGVAILNGNATINFRDVTANGGITFDGVFIRDFTGTANFAGTTTVAGAGDDGIDIQGGNGTLTFGTIDISNTTDDGITISDAQGTLNVTGPTTIANAGDEGIQINDSPIQPTFNGLTTITNPNGHGVLLNANIGQSLFNNLNITKAAATSSGFRINGGNLGGTGVTINNIDVSGFMTGIDLVSTLGNVTVNDGTVNNTANDGISVFNTNASFNSIDIGGLAGSTIGDDAVDVLNNDAVNRTFSFVNGNIGLGAGATVNSNGISVSSIGTGTLNTTVTTNQIVSRTETIRVSAGVNANSIILNLSDNGTLTRTTNGFTVDVRGSGLNSVIVTSLGAGPTQIIGLGPANGGGVLFSQVSFDADGNTGNGFQQVTGGTLQVGSNAANRVQGDGLSFLGTTGDIGFANVTIFNNGGTGLEVDTKLFGGTVFNLDVAAGSIDTTGGPVLFLDPLTGNMTFGSLAGNGTTTGGATNTGNSGNGSAITLDGFIGTLNVGQTNITNLGAGESGIRFLNNNAGTTANFGTTTISSANNNVTGIDLGNTNGETIRTGANSSINLTGTGTIGIDLTGANANFIFGDGTAPPTSTINAATLIDLTGFAPTPTTVINLLDLNFANQNLGPAFGQNNTHFFAQTARGTGDGSSIANASNTTTADANNAANVSFVAVGGGNLDVNVNGDGQFDLAADQDLTAFTVAGGTVNVGFTNPFAANLLINNTAGTFTDTANEGATALTTSSGNLNGAVVVIGQNSQLSDIQINASAGADGAGIIASGALGGSTLTNVDITGMNVGLFVTGATGALVADAASSISNAGVRAYDEDVSTANVTFNGTINQTGATAVRVNGRTAGTLTFGGMVTANSGASNAVHLTNAGGTVNFNDGLNIDTTTGTGLIALGSGTVNVAATAGDESISSTMGQAVEINFATTNINFDSISGNGNGAATTGVGIGNLGFGSSFTVSGQTTLNNYTARGVSIASLTSGNITINFGNTDVNRTTGVAGSTGIIIDNVSAANVDIDFATTQVGQGQVTTAGVAVSNVTNAAANFNTTFGSLNINRAQTGFSVDNVDQGSVNVTGNALVQNAQTANITVQGSTANVNFGGVTTTQNNSGFNGRHIGLGNTAANTGTTTFNGQVTTTSSGSAAGEGVNLGSGTATFSGGLSVTTLNGATALTQTGGTLNVNASAGNEILNSTGGRAIDISGAGSTVNATFDSVTSTNSGSEGIVINGVGAGSFSVTGTSTVNNATGDGIALTGNTATVTFGATNIDQGAGANTAAIDIEGVNSQINFGATTITDVKTGQTGIDFTGADAPATFGVTAISGPVNSGATGINLSSTQNNRAINFATGSSITFTGTGNSIGVQLAQDDTNATTANANFIFGDGALPTGSTISVGANGFTVDTIGLNAASGTYHFVDVAFTGNADLPVSGAGIVFVSQAGGLLNAGTFGLSHDVNTVDVATAEAAPDTNQTFVFVGNNLDFTANGADGFTLDDGQNADGFANGNSVAVGTQAQANVTGIAGTLTNVTANATQITNSNAVGDVFTLTGNNIIENIVVERPGATAQDIFSANGAVGTVTIQNTTIQNTNGGLIFNLSNTNGMVTIQNNTINTPTSQLFSATGTGNITITRGTGTVFSATRLEATKTGGSLTINGDLTLNSGVANALTLQNNTNTIFEFNGLLDIDTTGGIGVQLINNNTSTINFNGGLDIDTGTGSGFVATGGGTLHVNDPGGGTDANVTSTAGQAINLDGMIVAAGGLEFGTIISIGGVNGIRVNNLTGGQITFGHLAENVTITNSTMDGILLTNNAANIEFDNVAGPSVAVTAVNGPATLSNSILAALLVSRMPSIVELVMVTFSAR